MGAAQDRFTSILKDHWTPVLRELGFRGSGKIYVLPDPDDWAMLGFQGSRYSNSELLTFTINLMVVGKDDWEAARERHQSYSKRPSPNTIARHRYVQRIGHLLGRGDYWWSVHADGRGESAVIEEVAAALRDTATTTLRREIADKSPGPRGTFARNQ